jgi:hypothetical protein
MKKNYNTVDLTHKVKESIMSLSEVENRKELKNEFDLLDQQIQKDIRIDRHKAILGWITSLSIHSAILIVAMTVAFSIAREKETESLPIRIVSIEQPLNVDDIPKERDITKNDVLIETEKESNDKGPISELLLPEDSITSSENDITDNPNDMKRGREEAKADAETGGISVFMAIGVGGSSSGMFGSRIGTGKLRARAKMGPYGRPADAASEAGLRWLKKHQSLNGMWSASQYYINCPDAIKCEAGIDKTGADIAMTGYAISCFLGQGYDHVTVNKYRKVVKNGIEYLLSVQKPDGLLGERNYEHPIATLALIESYGMTSDQTLRIPSQKAVDIILLKQSKLKGDEYSRLGWDYVNPDANRIDASISGWNIMALKSAVGAGLNVGEAINGAKKYIDGAWKAANKDWDKLNDPYTDKSVFPYTWNANTNSTDRDHLSFVGATCAVFLGHKSGDIMLESMLNDAEERWIKNEVYKKNNYACYYLSLAQFQAGENHWKLCLDTLISNSIDTQRQTEDCFDGSWDYAGQSWHGADTGRVLSTCYNILNLQVAYRYMQITPGIKIKKK